MNKETSYREIFAFSYHYWRRYPKAGAALLSLMLAATVTDVFVPIYAGRIVDALVSGAAGDAAVLRAALFYLGIFAGLALTYNLLRWGALMVWNWFAVRCMYDILCDALYKVQRFSADWHANAFAGASVRKITRGMWAFDVFEDTLFVGLFPATIMMTGMTAMLLVQIPAVGMFTAAMIALYTGISIWLSVFVMASRFRASAAADTKNGAVLADIVTGNATVKAFGAEEREDALFKSIVLQWRGKSQNAWLMSETCNLVRGLLRMTMMVGMIGGTTLLWQTGRASPGDIALSLTSFFILGGYLREIGMYIANMQKSASEMEDVVAFRLQEDDISDAPDAGTLQRGDGSIAFDAVRFAYNGQNAPLYDDFSLTIRPGERIALVGPSGSGKSTFVKLLQRLYDIQSGAIRIDGQDIARVTQRSLRQAIALVPQEPVLFHRSLAENIAYGRPGATMEEIEDAARQAYAHDFISALPLGYGTLVGERGVKLSGGERQRVAIARAILADAPILILDEATSSLDSVSEHYIQKALERLMDGRTTITIAHRLATIKRVDRILVFEKGRIVEQGTHDELIGRADSLYRTLYDMQALDLTDDADSFGQRAAE